MVWSAALTMVGVSRTARPCLKAATSVTAMMDTSSPLMTRSHVWVSSRVHIFSTRSNCCGV